MQDVPEEVIRPPEARDEAMATTSTSSEQTLTDNALHEQASEAEKLGEVDRKAVACTGADLPQSPDFTNRSQEPGDVPDENHDELEDDHDPNEVGWDGPDDPQNPQNFSKWRKRGIIVLCIILTINVVSVLLSGLIFPPLSLGFPLFPLGLILHF